MTITNSRDKDAARRSLRKVHQLIPKINKVLHLKLQAKAPTETTQGRTVLSECRKMLKIKEIKEFRRWWVLIIRNKWCLLARARGISVWTRQLVEQHKQRVKPRVSMDQGIAGRSNNHRRFWQRKSHQPELVELKSVIRYKKRRIWWRTQKAKKRTSQVQTRQRTRLRSSGKRLHSATLHPPEICPIPDPMPN